MEEDTRSRKSCCFVFSLQTGVATIVLLDLSIFVLICGMVGLTFTQDGDSHAEGDSALEEDGTLFTLMTDGFLVLLFFIKMSTGLYYLVRTLRPPAMDYAYLEEFGRLKWHTRRIKR